MYTATVPPEFGSVSFSIERRIGAAVGCHTGIDQRAVIIATVQTAEVRSLEDDGGVSVEIDGWNGKRDAALPLHVAERCCPEGFD